MTDDEYEALEERASIIQFCSGTAVSRETAWRMACEQQAMQNAELVMRQSDDG